MLVLSRKRGESVRLGSDILLKVLDVRPDQVLLQTVLPWGSSIDLDEATGAGGTEEVSRQPQVTADRDKQVVETTCLVGHRITINNATRVIIDEIRGEKVQLRLAAPASVVGCGEQAAPPLSSDVLLQWVADKVNAYLETHPQTTLQQLADKVGVSAATINRWRSRKTNVAKVHLPALLAAVETGLDDLKRDLNLSSVELPEIKARGPAGRKAQSAGPR